MRFITYFFANLLSKFVFRYRKVIAVGLISSWASIVAFFQNPQAHAPKIEKHLKAQEVKVTNAFNKFGKYACKNIYGKKFLGIEIPKMKKVCRRL